MNRDVKIVVLDLDGTLTNSKKELTERNKSTLIELQKRGVRVVLASGRPTYGIVPLAQELQLAEYEGYILSFNGGVIIDCATNQAIHSTVLPMELIKPLYTESKEAGAVILSYDHEYIITESPEDIYVGKEAFLNKMAVRKVESFVDVITAPVPKCLTVGEPEKLISLEERLKSLYGSKMSIYRSEPFFLELVPLGIDKANSLGVLLSHLECDKESMVAFGDGFNDLSMIEYAGWGVAMSNAQEVVKSRANDVALSNDEDGVAEYIERVIFPWLR
ncbi:MAG: Cof-type HAD-IIB family hydrolase [Rikenellaceae bacterium]